MRSTPPKTARFLTPLIALALFSTAAWARDAVKLKDGRTIEGKIVAFTSREVRIEADGKVEAFPNAALTGFTLDDAPAGIRQGDLFAGAGDFDRAIGSYQAALSEVTRGRVRDLHRPFILQKIARAHRAKGDIEDALAALETLRAEGGDSRLRAESFQESLEAARQRKDRAALARVLAEMEKEPEPLAGTARLERGKLKVETSDLAGALEIFDRLAASEPDGPQPDGPQPNGKERPYAAEARAWGLRTLRGLGKTEALETACRAAIEKGGSNLTLLQAAHSFLGEMLIEKPGKDPAKDPAAAREALLEFARAIAQGPPAVDGHADDYARSLIGAARACLLLGPEEAAAELRRHYRTRAQGYLREAVRSFKGTAWAKLASEELAQMGG